MGKAVTISPNSSKLTPQTVRRSGYKFRERQPPCIKQALIGHKKRREFGIRKGLKKLVISSKIRIFIGENQ